VQSGLDGKLDHFYDVDEENEPRSALEWAWRQHETPG